MTPLSLTDYKHSNLYHYFDTIAINHMVTYIGTPKYFVYRYSIDCHNALTTRIRCIQVRNPSNQYIDFK